MLANGFTSVADALSAVHFLIAMLSWRHTIPNFRFFADILRIWPNSLPLLVELVQATAAIENVLGYVKARQCASLRSLTSVREDGQKVVRLVIHERSNDRHNAAEFDFTGFSDGLSMRIREYHDLIPRSSPRSRPSSTQCEALVQALGKMLEGVLREYYVPFIKLNEGRLRELDVTFRDGWEKSIRFIVLCLDKARRASRVEGMTSQLNCGINAEDIDLLYGIIRLRNKASHSGEAKEAIRWGDVVKFEEILLDGDLLRRLVAYRSSAAPGKS